MFRMTCKRHLTRKSQQWVTRTCCCRRSSPKSSVKKVRRNRSTNEMITLRYTHLLCPILILLLCDSFQLLTHLMDLFEKGDDYIQIILPPSMTNKLSMENIEATAGRVGVKLFQRLWLTDQTTGLVSLTPKPALVMVMPDRRQSQTRLKKSSNAHQCGYYREHWKRC